MAGTRAAPSAAEPFGFSHPLLKRRFHGIRGGHVVQEREQGSAIDEVGGADGLDAADGFHEVLGGRTTHAEELLNVLPGPGLGPGVLGSLANGMEIAGPFDWPGHENTSKRQSQDTGIAGTPANYFPSTYLLLPTTMYLVEGSSLVRWLGMDAPQSCNSHCKIARER